MFDLYREIEDTDNILRSIALPSIQIPDVPAQGQNYMDTGDVLLRYRRQLYERNQEVRQIMWGLAEEEESICRVWNCFYALKDPYYSILYALYVENQIYQTVEIDYGWSHKTFEKKRKHGIKQILKFYESDLTANQLICQG